MLFFTVGLNRNVIGDLKKRGNFYVCISVKFDRLSGNIFKEMFRTMFRIGVLCI